MDGVGPTISTHILDTELGAPARGVPVRLTRLGADGGMTAAGVGRTDDDGRILRLASDALTPGIYRLTFELHGYRPGFFREVTLDLDIVDATRSYHVPLLVAPFAVTSYRGS